MNAVQCCNNHFYDGDKYTACPHCGAAPLDTATSATAKSKKHDEKSQVSMTPIPEHAVGKTFGIFKKKDQNEYSVQSEHLEQTQKSEPNPIESSVQSTPQQTHEPAQPEQTELRSQIGKNPPVLETSVQPMQISPDQSGKTQGFFAIKQSSDPARQGTTVSLVMAPVIDNMEPCAGWLVCVKGMYFGRNLPIYAGKNSIGREESNRICLKGDMSVSREKHSWVMYEPKKREFYVIPGEGSGLTYLNGENLMAATELSPYDKIEIGDGLYMFVPLCCDKFTWEDYM